MKLRLRCLGRTIVITLEDPDREPTLLHLKETITEHFQSSDFQVSLNGKDPISGGDDIELKELDIVSGDLIHVLTSQPVAPQPCQQPQVKGNVDNPNAREGKSGPLKAVPSGPSKNHEHTNTASADNPQASCSTAGESAAQLVEMDFSEDDEAVQDAEVNRYLNEPTLVRDSTESCVPQSLCQAFRSGPIECAGDALVAVLHVLMVETGYNFVTQPAAGLGTCNLPPGWKCGSTYRLGYTHSSCPETEFCLTAVPMGTKLIVHGLAKGTTPPVHCQLPVKLKDYVKEISTDPTQTCYNLPKLSRIFKDKIAHALLQKAAEVLDLPMNHGFLGLIFELKLHVLKFLDARSLCHFACVCKELRSLSSESVLWRRLYLTDFGRRTNNDLSQDWYQLYREKFVLRQRMRRDFLRCTIVVPPFLGRPNPPLPMAPVYPPGFIGGDYDRDPDFAGIPDPLGMGRPSPNPLFSRPRFDPVGPLPHQNFPPGRGGGIWESARPRPSFSGFGPKFF